MDVMNSLCLPPTRGVNMSDNLIQLLHLYCLWNINHQLQKKSYNYGALMNNLTQHWWLKTKHNTGSCSYSERQRSCSGCVQWSFINTHALA